MLRRSRCVQITKQYIIKEVVTIYDNPLLFVFFQVNTGVVYFLDYVEDIYIMLLSVLVSTLNLKSYVFNLPLLLTVYCIALYTYKLCTKILPVCSLCPYMTI